MNIDKLIFWGMMGVMFFGLIRCFQLININQRRIVTVYNKAAQAHNQVVADLQRIQKIINR